MNLVISSPFLSEPCHFEPGLVNAFLNRSNQGEIPIAIGTAKSAIAGIKVSCPFRSPDGNRDLALVSSREMYISEPGSK